MLIYIQEVIWMEDQGEGTSLRCTLYFSYFRTSFSFSLWLGEWDHFTRRTETFQMISNMYGYFLYILHCMGFSVNSRWWGAVQGVDHPVCWGGEMMRPSRDSSCWFQEGLLSSRGGGGAQTYWHQAYTRLTPKAQFVWLVWSLWCGSFSRPWLGWKRWARVGFSWGWAWYACSVSANCAGARNIWCVQYVFWAAKAIDLQ